MNSAPWHSSLDDVYRRMARKPRPSSPPEASLLNYHRKSPEYTTSTVEAQGIELDNMSRHERDRDRERLLSDKPSTSALERKQHSSSTAATAPYMEGGYLSSDDEVDSAALLKGKSKDRTSWFTTPPVRRRPKGNTHKGTKVSKCAVCIGIVGGLVVLVSLAVGGGVMVLGRKPVAKSEGWYPSRQYSLTLSSRLSDFRFE